MNADQAAWVNFGGVLCIYLAAFLFYTVVMGFVLRMACSIYNVRAGGRIRQAPWLNRAWPRPWASSW